MKFQVLVSLAMLFLTSCVQNNTTAEKGVQVLTATIAKKPIESEGYKLLKQNCYACHNPLAASHDDLLAPPMVAVKRRYKVSYDSKEDFTKAIVEWSKDPKEENAMMRGAVDNFKVMPKQTFDENDLKVIAEYIWDNELEKPEWFDAHFKEKHPNGMGNGQGQGKKI